MHREYNLDTITEDQQKIINTCPHRLKYHAMAPCSWINDPNGFIYYNNEFHLFFQFNPKEPKWGLIHWGHYKSKNLIDWEYLPIALSPDKSYDKDGCFSGSAIAKDNQLYLFYTGNISEDNQIIKQTQCMAVSQDGIHFEKYLNNPILSMPPEGSRINDFRDPWVWKRDDYYYMVVGARPIKNTSGQVILYRSQNLTSWEYINTISNDQKRLGYMWECPSIFNLDDKDILMFSPQGMESQGELYNNQYQSGYVYGILDYKKGIFDYGDFHELDRGFDFYAPQTTIDAKGRRIMIAWMDMWESEMPTMKNLWAGAMTLPRELVLGNDGEIKYLPIKEIESLRKNEIRIENIKIQQDTILPHLEGTAFELIFEIERKHILTDTFSLILRANHDYSEKTLLSYSRTNHKLTLNRNDSGFGPKGIRTITLNQYDSTLKLRIFVDHSSIEIFVNEGEYVMSARIYPQLSSKYINFLGEAYVNKIIKWDLD